VAVLLAVCRTADGVEYVLAGGRLAEIGDATCGLGLLAAVGFVVGRDEDDGRARAGSSEASVELDAGHPAQLDIQDQAVELRPVGVGKKGLGGGIAHRLHPVGPKKPTQGATRAVVVIDDRDAGRAGPAHLDTAILVIWP
jgi:hypothetical protein